MLSSVFYVHQKLLVSKYTAIIQLIYGYLTKAISIYAQSEKNICIRKKYIPLSKGKNDIKISYISGVALHFSKSHNSQHLLIANSIASYLSDICGKDLLVQVLPNSLIHIEVSDSILAAWLQRFIDNRKEETVEIDCSSQADVFQFGEKSIFSIQYIHARCSSLLRLAQQEKIIECDRIDSESIPWLNTDAQLCLNNQAERLLISSLVKLVDELEPVIARPLKWEGAASSLVKAFESFWSSCRICGDLKENTPEQIMARVGLVMATRSVLQFLLEEKLGISACWEL